MLAYGVNIHTYKYNNINSINLPTTYQDIIYFIYRSTTIII